MILSNKSDHIATSSNFDQLTDDSCCVSHDKFVLPPTLPPCICCCCCCSCCLHHSQTLIYTFVHDDETVFDSSVLWSTCVDRRVGCALRRIIIMMLDIAPCPNDPRCRWVDRRRDRRGRLVDDDCDHYLSDEESCCLAVAVAAVLGGSLSSLLFLASSALAVGLVADSLWASWQWSIIFFLCAVYGGVVCLAVVVVLRRRDVGMT